MKKPKIITMSETMGGPWAIRRLPISGYYMWDHGRGVGFHCVDFNQARALMLDMCETNAVPGRDKTWRSNYADNMVDYAFKVWNDVNPKALKKFSDEQYAFFNCVRVVGAWYAGFGTGLLVCTEKEQVAEALDLWKVTKVEQKKQVYKPGEGPLSLEEIRRMLEEARGEGLDAGEFPEDPEESEDSDPPLQEGLGE